MTVKSHLGWEREEGSSRPAIRFTGLIKTYTRLRPSGEDQQESPGNGAVEREETAAESASTRIADFPQLRDWATAPQAANMLSISRAAVHQKFMQGEFRSVHRLGDTSRTRGVEERGRKRKHMARKGCEREGPAYT